jgi:hypothetical protein
MMMETLPHQLLAVLVVEESSVMILSLFQLLPKLATLISLPSILLVTLAPGMTCTVELTVKALGMMKISQLLPNAALAVEEIIFQLKILLRKLLKQSLKMLLSPKKLKLLKLLLLMPPLPMVLLLKKLLKKLSLNQLKQVLMLNLHRLKLFKKLLKRNLQLPLKPLKLKVK